VKTAEVATPLAFVVAVFAPPANVPLAPLFGAVNVTTTPNTGLLLASLTVATNGAPNAVLIAALCPEPLVTETVAGGPVTVNATPLLAVPPTVTTTFPVVAPVGTFTTIVVAFQLVAVPPDTPLNVTVLVPWLAPKFAPLIVIDAPTCPVGGFTLVMLGPAPPAPAARNATICMTHGCTRSRAAVAL